MTRGDEHGARSWREHGDGASGNKPTSLLSSSLGASSHRTIYTWTCPYCDTSRTRAGSDPAPAEHALKLHVLNSEGKGHGGRNAYPSTLDTEALDQHVTRTDG